ncbi:MAG: D-alanyl-D-alanine carboxypeptidase family protein [Neisseria sp.]|nr:D-alanyl-D-alanine carboxypeptidase family protein [Neisseria sp.]
MEKIKGFARAVLLAVSQVYVLQTASAGQVWHVPRPAAEIRQTEVPRIQSPVYRVQDLQSGRVLAERGSSRKIEPASFNKLMTAYLVFQALDEGRLQVSQQVGVSEKAWQAEGSRMFLQRGQQVGIGDLLRGLAAVSANDAAVALAEAVSGSEEAFVVQMNDAAQRLGMKHTYFSNATGKPDGVQKTTAEDLVRLAGEIVRVYTAYLPIFTEKSFIYRKIEQPNPNLMLFRDSDADGLMSAIDSAGGRNVLVSSRRGGRKVLVLLAGAGSREQQTAESSRLLNWALQAYDTVQVYDADKALTQVKIYKGRQSKVPVGSERAVFLTVPHGVRQNIKPILETVQPVFAPVRKGQVLGTLKIMHRNEILFEGKAVALETVEKSSGIGSLIDDFLLWLDQLFAGTPNRTR